MATLYFDMDHAIVEHDNIINISGGLHGFHDINLLESVLFHVQNDSYYPLLSDKLTHLVYSIAMNHAFSDGNKRSSIVLGAYFLEINGYGSIVGKFILEMENVVLWVAQDIINKELLLEIMCNLLEFAEITEETKLKIFTLFQEHPLE